ncbi:hypothetical protein L218DRAFT_949464 [Marasmius fiardii PR-910]|nr:hypothetical protein L218DRAFT_949464 [Marasmius fiardii PR-910]
MYAPPWRLLITKQLLQLYNGEATLKALRGTYQLIQIIVGVFIRYVVDTGTHTILNSESWRISVGRQMLWGLCFPVTSVDHLCCWTTQSWRSFSAGFVRHLTLAPTGNPGGATLCYPHRAPEHSADDPLIAFARTPCFLFLHIFLGPRSMGLSRRILPAARPTRIYRTEQRDELVVELPASILCTEECCTHRTSDFDVLWHAVLRDSVYVWFFILETKGLSLEEVIDGFTRRWCRTIEFSIGRRDVYRTNIELWKFATCRVKPASSGPI